MSQGTIKPCRDNDFHTMLEVAKLSFKIKALYFCNRLKILIEDDSKHSGA